MADLIRYGETALTQFNPAQTREKIAHLDGDIVTARQLKDWPKLIAAVEEKTEEQKRFVKNWDVEVQDAHRPLTVTSGLQLSVETAEDKWGIGKMTVSRWRSWTSPENVDAYRERIIL